jgi:hypothetical protein
MRACSPHRHAHMRACSPHRHAHMRACSSHRACIYVPVGHTEVPSCAPVTNTGAHHSAPVHYTVCAPMRSCLANRRAYHACLFPPLGCTHAWISDNRHAPMRAYFGSPMHWGAHTHKTPCTALRTGPAHK